MENPTLKPKKVTQYYWDFSSDLKNIQVRTNTHHDVVAVFYWQNHSSEAIEAAKKYILDISTGKIRPPTNEQRNSR